MAERTEAEALIEVAQKAVAQDAQPHPEIEGLYLGVLDDDHGLRDYDLERYLPAPRRKHGSVTLHDAASFGAYVNRHASPGTVLYADCNSNRIVAVLNDHASDGPGWGDHTATLQLAHTREWQHWASQDGKLQGQQAFAEHIEQGLLEIVEPPSADMLELAQSFEAKSSASFKSGNLLQDGSRQLVYQETVDARAGQTGNITIPKQFKLGIAPYEGTDPYEIVARLRYRLQSEHLTIGYTLVRPHDVLRAAFGDVLVAIEASTGLTPLQGIRG